MRKILLKHPFVINFTMVTFLVIFVPSLIATESQITAIAWLVGYGLIFSLTADLSLGSNLPQKIMNRLYRKGDSVTWDGEEKILPTGSGATKEGTFKEIVPKEKFNELINAGAKTDKIYGLLYAEVVNCPVALVISESEQYLLPLSILKYKA